MMKTKTHNTGTVTGAGKAPREEAIGDCEIWDCDLSQRYFVTRESECQEADRSAYRSAIALDDVITMGKTIVTPMRIIRDISGQR